MRVSVPCTGYITPFEHKLSAVVYVPDVSTPQFDEGDRHLCVANVAGMAESKPYGGFLGFTKVHKAGKAIVSTVHHGMGDGLGVGEGGPCSRKHRTSTTSHSSRDRNCGTACFVRRNSGKLALPSLKLPFAFSSKTISNNKLCISTK